MNNDTQSAKEAAYSDAIDFAIDHCSVHDAVFFLRLWRDGDWRAIRDGFTDYTGNVAYPKA